MLSLLMAAVILIGQTGVFPAADSGNGNLLIAQRATLTQQATLTALSFYVDSAAGQLRLSVYDASGAGGGPGKLVAETGAFTTVMTADGWNTKPVVTQVKLNPGTYWLAYHPASNNLVFRKNDASNGCVIVSRTFGAPPATFPSAGQNVISTQWSFYATFETVPTTPLQGSAPSGLSVSLSKFGQMRFAWDAVTTDVDGNPASPTGYRLYVGVGTSGCPGGPHVDIAAPATTGGMSHLPWAVNHSGQVTTLASGQESACSNVATGQPK